MTPSKEYIVPSKEGFYRKYCPEVFPAAAVLHYLPSLRYT